MSERSASHSVSAGVWADVLRLNPLHSEAASEYLRLNGTRDRTERDRDLISFIEDFKNDREQRLGSLVAPAGVVAALAETAQILTECCIKFRNPQEDETDLFFQTWQAAVSLHETVDKDRVLALNIAIEACEAIGQRKLFHPSVWECVERLVLSAHSWAGKDTLMSLWFGVRRLSQHHKDWGLYPRLADKLAKVGYCGEVDSDGLAFASLKDDNNFCLDVIEGFVRAGDNARAIEYLSDLREVKKVKGSELQWIEQVLDACREKGAYDVWEVALRCRLTEFHNERELSYWSELAALYEQHLAQPLLAFASYVVVLTRFPHDTEALEACKRLSPALPAELGADYHESVLAILDLLHLQDPNAPLDTVRFLLSHGKLKDATGVIVSTCDVTPSETGFEVAIRLWLLTCSQGLPPFGMKELDCPTVHAARTITNFDQGSVENEDEFTEALRAVLSIGHESENEEPSPHTLQHSQLDPPTRLLASARERSSFRAKASEFFTEPDSVRLTMSFVGSLERVIGKVSAVCFLVWILDNLVFQSLPGRANEDGTPSHFGDRPASEESATIFRELTRVTCARVREVAASLATPITGIRLLSLCLEQAHSDETKRFLRQLVASARSGESE